MLVRADNGGIDHHVFVVVIARQLLENALENPALGPPVEALADDLIKLSNTKPFRMPGPFK